MNYFNIVVDGYLDPTTKKYLDKYLVRQFSIAEKDGYTVDEFFDGCFSVITAFHKYLDNMVHNRKSELNQLIILSSNDNEAIKGYLKEVSEEKRHKYFVNLYFLTRDIRYNGIQLNYNQVCDIESNIINAKAQFVKIDLAEVRKKSKELTPPKGTTGVFCWLVNYLGIIPKENIEDIIPYCERVCNHYKIPYSDTVRRNFKAPNKRELNKVIEKVIPFVKTDNLESLIKKISTYIVTYK